MSKYLNFWIIQGKSIMNYSVWTSSIRIKLTITIVLNWILLKSLNYLNSSNYSNDSNTWIIQIFKYRRIIWVNWITPEELFKFQNIWFKIRYNYNYSIDSITICTPLLPMFKQNLILYFILDFVIICDLFPYHWWSWSRWTTCRRWSKTTSRHTTWNAF